MQIAFLGSGPRSWVRSLGMVSLVAAGAAVACSGKSNADFSDPAGSGASGGTGGNGGSGGKGTGGAGGTAGTSSTTGGSGGAAGGSGGASAGRGGAAGTGGASAGSGGVENGGKGGGAGTESEGGATGCEPTTCKAEGAVCGSLPDGCGAMIQCGNCPTGCSCGSDNHCAGEGGAGTERRHGQRARSSGFSGTEMQYNELYDLPACADVDDCIPACIERGGTTEMCAGTQCIHSTEDYCLPQTIWTNLVTLAAEGSDIYLDGAQLVLWSNPYRDFLLVDDFKLEVPAGATILGITVTVRRSAGGPDEAVDAGVHVIKGGVVGSADRSSPTPWAGGTEFGNVDYGGPSDLWGETWTPADVNAADFGVALSAGYTQSAGNGRAYVDIVYVTVHYTSVCQ